MGINGISVGNTNVVPTGKTQTDPPKGKKTEICDHPGLITEMKDATGSVNPLLKNAITTRTLDPFQDSANSVLKNYNNNHSSNPYNGTALDLVADLKGVCTMNEKFAETFGLLSLTTYTTKDRISEVEKGCLDKQIAPTEVEVCPEDQ